MSSYEVSLANASALVRSEGEYAVSHTATMALVTEVEAHYVAWVQFTYPEATFSEYPLTGDLQGVGTFAAVLGGYKVITLEATLMGAGSLVGEIEVEQLTAELLGVGSFSADLVRARELAGSMMGLGALESDVMGPPARPQRPSTLNARSRDSGTEFLPTEQP